MGRPKKPEDEKAIRITISFDPDLVERVDKIAKIVGKPRSRMVQDLTSAALEQVEALETFRLLSFGALVRDNIPVFRRKFKEALLESEKEATTDE